MVLSRPNGRRGGGRHLGPAHGRRRPAGPGAQSVVRAVRAHRWPMRGKVDGVSMKGVRAARQARRSVPRLTEAAESGMDCGVPTAVDDLRGLVAIRHRPCRAVRGRGS
jgi:hypothetical protein